MIKKTVSYNSNPALHIAEIRVVECPSGPSPAQFLMVFLTKEVLFIDHAHYTWEVKEEGFILRSSTLSKYNTIGLFLLPVVS